MRNLVIVADFISGCKIGLEFMFDYQIATIDLFIIRFIFDWSGDFVEE